MTSSQDIKYDFVPANPDPGDDYDKWRERCLNAMAKSDERGWSKADHLLGIDEGGPAGPPMPGGAAANKAQQAFRSSQKNSYGTLAHHVLDPGHITHMANNHLTSLPPSLGHLRKLEYASFSGNPFDGMGERDARLFVTYLYPKKIMAQARDVPPTLS